PHVFTDLMKPLLRERSQMATRLATTKRRATGKKVQRDPHSHAIHWIARCFNLVHTQPQSRTRKTTSLANRRFDDSLQLVLRALGDGLLHGVLSLLKTSAMRRGSASP